MVLLWLSSVIFAAVQWWTVSFQSFGIRTAIVYYRRALSDPCGQSDAAVPHVYLYLTRCWKVRWKTEPDTFV